MMAEKKVSTFRSLLNKITNETKVYVRRENEDEKRRYKFKLDNSHTVQKLLKLIRHEFGGEYGTEKIELFYDDISASDSETALLVTEKMGALKFHNLVCKIKPETKIVSEVDSSTRSNDDAPIQALGQAFEESTLASTNASTSPNTDIKGNGYKSVIVLEQSNGSEIKETIIPHGPNQQRTAILIGRTGSGKSLLGCVLLDKYGDNAFKVSGGVNSCTKYAEFKQSIENQITVHDTKGFFDTETECMRDYASGTDEKKLQIIEEIMHALKKIQATGVHAIFLVVKMGNRFDIKDKDIIDHLGAHVFNDDLRKKVYLVCTNSAPKLCNNHQNGIDWLNEQCQEDANSPSEGSAVTSKVFNQYYEVIEHDMNRVFFVQNKNPDDYDDQDEVNKCKKDNKKMAQKIIKSLRERGNETVNLREKYKTLTEEFDKLMTAKDKKEFFENNVRPDMHVLGQKNCFCSIL